MRGAPERLLAGSRPLVPRWSLGTACALARSGVRLGSGTRRVVELNLFVCRELRWEIQEGLDSAPAGKLDINLVIRRGRRRLAARARARS